MSNLRKAHKACRKCGATTDHCKHSAENRRGSDGGGFNAYMLEYMERRKQQPLNAFRMALGLDQEPDDNPPKPPFGDMC